jgi:hypothetical protein
MFCALDGVVGPASQKVPSIDYNGLWNRRCVDEVSIRRFDLKSASGVLEEKCYGALESQNVCK